MKLPSSHSSDYLSSNTLRLYRAKNIFCKKKEEEKKKQRNLTYSHSPINLTNKSVVGGRGRDILRSVRRGRYS